MSTQQRDNTKKVNKMNSKKESFSKAISDTASATKSASFKTAINKCDIMAKLREHGAIIKTSDSENAA